MAIGFSEAKGSVTSKRLATAIRNIRKTGPSEMPMPFTWLNPLSPPPTLHQGSSEEPTRMIAPIATIQRPLMGVAWCIAAPLGLVGLGAENAHEAEVPVDLAEVETIPHHEGVRNLEANIVDRDVDQAAGGLVQERADPYRARVLALEVAEQVVEREACIDDVLDEQDISSLDWRTQILEDPDQSGRFRGGATVARDLHEIYPQRQADSAHQVRHERQRSLQHADQGQFAARVVGADPLPKLGHLALDLFLGQQHLGDVREEVPGDFHRYLLDHVTAAVTG